MTFVLVMGMHRSGTSMLTNMLAVAGLEVGENYDLLPPMPDNAKGYWENKFGVMLNDEVLEILGGSWRQVPHFEPGWENDRRFDLLVRRMQGQVGNSQQQTVVFKDPRNSLTSPLWKRAFPDLKMIIALRNPLEIAESLNKGLPDRDFSFQEATALWQAYNETILQSIDPTEALWTHFETYLSEPEAELKRILEFIGATAPQEKIEQALKVVEAELKHYAIPSQLVHGDYPSLAVVQYYGYLCQLCGPHWAAAQNQTRQYQVLQTYLHTQVTAQIRELRQARHDLAQQNYHLNQLRAQFEDTQQKLTQAEQTLSELQQHAASLDQQLATAHGYNQQLQQHATNLESHRQHLEAELTEAQNKLAVLNQQLQEDRQTLKQQLQNLQDQLLASEQSRENLILQVQYSQQNAALLEQQLRQELQKTAATSEQHLHDLRQQLATSENGRDNLRRQLEQSQQNAIKFEYQFNQLQQRFAELDTHNTHIQSTLNELLWTTRQAQLKPTLPKRLKGVLLRPFPRSIRLNRANRLLRNSALFDPEWYYKEYPDVAKAGIDALWHFLRYGAAENRKPNVLFDTAWYLEQNWDVAARKMNPLVHYISFGAGEGRNPHPYFDNNWYLEQNPDVAAQKQNPLEHYLRFGAAEGRDPNPNFDSDWYLAEYPDVAAAKMNPLVHYVLAGKREGRKTSPQHLAAKVFQPITPRQSPPISHDYQEFIQQELQDSFRKSQEIASYQPNYPITLENPSAKLIAFYLPQFHPTPENNRFWGNGFTEWTNVSKARPLFPGHYQPRLPGDLGFYDLRLVENLHAQADLAKQHNIAGFAIYRYWFNGKTVLDHPLELLYDHQEIDIQYCLVWANENWTRRWDGFDHEVLLAQEHSPEDDLDFIANAERFFQDKRYLRIDDKPILIIYNIQKIPNPQATADRWRKFMHERGYAGIYLMVALTFGLDQDAQSFGFDAGLQFPPHNLPTADPSPHLHYFTEFKGRMINYDDLIPYSTSSEHLRRKVYKTVIPDWDNTSRRWTKSLIVMNSTPQKYMEWLSIAIQQTLEYHSPEERLVFINAWNEWAESAYLEPDRRLGYAYLNATSQVLAQFSENATSTIVFLGHDAARAGAEILLKSVVAWFAEHSNFQIKLILGEGGDLIEDFRALVPTFIISEQQSSNESHIRQEIQRFVGDNVKLIYANTCVVGKYLHYLPKDIPILSHIHELELSIQRYCPDDIQILVQKSSHFIAVSRPVQALLQEGYAIPNEKITLIHEFIEPFDSSLAQNKLAIVGNQETAIVWGCGTVELRKGFDLFVEVALKVYQAYPKVKFAWIGLGRDEFIDPEAYIRSKGAEQAVLYLGVKDNPREYFAVGDIFALTSREDPYPLVALEAADCFLPIVCFAETGGMPNFVEDDAGFVVPYLDTDAMANRIVTLLKDTRLRERMGIQANEKFQQKHTAEATLPQIYKLVQETIHPKPKVSIIVPAYNHAPYLRRRLDSIYEQTFQNFEVILLDDCSPDESLAILREYAARYPQNTRLINNQANSGSTFAQWIKGLEQAKADLIWIAEDDDFSDLRFLETMLPYFSDPQIKLAYAQSYAVDENSQILFNYDVYTAEFSATRWASVYVVDGETEINFALAKKNTIPNASAVIFRKFDYREWGKAWQKAKLTGDWAFYLYALRDGKIAFHPEPLNYHRRHENTNIKRYEVAENRFFESAQVQKTILQLYPVTDETKQLMRQGSLENWQAVYPQRSEEEFAAVYETMLNGSVSL